MRNEAGQRLMEFCQENALVIANTLFQQDKRRLYTWTSPDGQHWNQIDYILCSQRWRSSIQSAKTRLGADCGSDHELLIAKFRLKLKNVGKTTRPFRYDLNQIPYDYTVEVRNRFKGLDLIECLMNYGRRFMTLYRRQGSRPSPWKSESEVSQSCPTFCDPMDCSLPHSSVHRIFQARVLEWVAISFSRGSSRPRDRTQADTLTSEPPGE